MADGQWRVSRFESRERAKRNLLAARGMHVNILERTWVGLKLRIDFHNHVILVELRKNGRDLALAEGVVQSVINVGRKHADSRGSVAVDGKRGEQPLSQLIGGHIAQLGEVLQLIHKAGNPVREFLGVHVFQTVLELRSADAIFNGQILHRLHEQGGAIHFRYFRLQTPDYLHGIDFSDGQRLQIYLKPAAVEGDVGAINTNKRRKRFDGGILKNNVGELLLALRHGSEGDILRAFGNSQDDAGILHREKPLWDIYKKQNRCDKGCHSYSQGDTAKTQHHLECSRVKINYIFETALGGPIQPALLLFDLMA